jgi:hypothetical protein
MSDNKQLSASEEVLATLRMAAVTPKQVEAINALTSGTVPGQHVSRRRGRAGKTFSYVKHVYANELVRDAFGILWSYEVLSTTAYDDASASALVCLTLYIPQEDKSYLEIRTTAVGAHEDTSGKMCKAYMVASAASRGLCKTLMRRFGFGAEFVQDEVQMTAKESWTALWRFAQRKDPTVEQDAVVVALKAVGITRDNLVDRFEQAYSIVSKVVSMPLEDIPENLDKESSQKPIATDTSLPEPVEAPLGDQIRTGTIEQEKIEADPLVEAAEKELGAEPVSATSSTGQKVNFIKLYTYAKEKFGFDSTEVKAVLLPKLGREWYYKDKQLIVDTLAAAKAMGSE